MSGDRTGFRSARSVRSHQMKPGAYLEDFDDTHRRYITSQTVRVTLGPSVPQTITTRSVYSSDGRFLPLQAIDALGSITRFEYDDYNQMTAVVDAFGHRRESTYDVAAQPTAATPNRYDLVRSFETGLMSSWRPTTGGSAMTPTRAPSCSPSSVTVSARSRCRSGSGAFSRT